MVWHKLQVVEDWLHILSVVRCQKTTPYVSFKITYYYLFSKVHQSEWLTPDTLKVLRRILKWGPIMMRLSNPDRLTSEGTHCNLWGIWFFLTDSTLPVNHHDWNLSWYFQVLEIDCCYFRGWQNRLEQSRGERGKIFNERSFPVLKIILGNHINLNR